MSRHAHPAVLIDRVVAGGPESAAAVKLVSAGDASFGAAAPDGSPPAAALVEALAQAALRLAGGEAAPEEGAGGPGLLVACDGVRIARRPLPGDRLRIAVSLVRRFGDLIQVESRASLETEDAGPPPLVAEGTFTLSRGVASRTEEGT